MYSRNNIDLRSVLISQESRAIAHPPAALIALAVTTSVRKAAPKPNSRPRRLENPKATYSQ